MKRGCAGTDVKTTQNHDSNYVLRPLSDDVTDLIPKGVKTKEACSNIDELPIMYAYNNICPACHLSSSSCFRFFTALEYYGHVKDRTVDIVWH